jgi:hypothetical protein
MGTSAGYQLPTSGNWGNSKREVTAFGNSDSSDATSVGRVMNEYVQAHGGAQQMAQTMSVAHRAGVRFGGLLEAIQHNGLSNALAEVGLPELRGQPAEQVLQEIADYLAAENSVMEGDIVRQALFDYYDEVFGDVKTFDDLEALFSQLLGQGGVAEVLKRFFGFCVYRRFRTHYTERLLQTLADPRKLFQKMRDIKEYIFSKLNVITFNRDLLSLNWRGSDGEKMSQNILESVVNVFIGE